MGRKLFDMIVLLAAAGIMPSQSLGDAAPSVLRIHLPREVTVQGSLLTLGQISVIRGEPATAAVASRIGMGQLSMPGQRAVLDRPTILSRLASNGIMAQNVRLTGAEAVAVRRFSTVIGAEEFIEAGQAFLQKHPPAPMICEVIPTVRPKDLVLPSNAVDLQVTPKFVRSGARGHVAIQIVVTADGKEVGTREITFRLKYRCHRVVTTEKIAEGTVLTAENIRLETVSSDQPEPIGWRPPYGLVAVRELGEGLEVRPDMVNAAQSPVLVRRNETVLIHLEMPGLTVTAMGVALQEGRTGDCVKVRNADSSRVIVCKVNADGSVEPML